MRLATSSLFALLGLAAATPVFARQSTTLRLPPKVTCSVPGETPCAAEHQILTQRIDTLTIELTPSGGAIHGQPGETIGWGFRVAWHSDSGDYLRFESARPSSTPVAGEWFADNIGPRGGPTAGAMAPNTTWTQAFDAASSQGVGQYKLAATAKGGAADTGNLVFTFSVFDGDPGAGGRKVKTLTFGECTDPDPSVCAEGPTAYVVTVDGTASPAPAPAIAFGDLDDKTFGDAPFEVSATASDGGAVIFSSATVSVCAVSGSTVTLASAGLCTLRAAHATNDAVEPRFASFTVGFRTPTITWTPPGALAPGAALTEAQLNAVADAPGTFTYSPALGTVVQAGQVYEITATFTPDDPAAWTSASTSRVITSSRITPEIAWTAPAPIVYGTPLGAAQLSATASVPGTFSYSSALGTVLAAGSHTLSVTFTPADTAQYADAEAAVTVTVTPAPLTVRANNISISHRAPYLVFTGTIVGAANGDVFTATYAAAASTVPGAYPIVPTLAANAALANYTVTVVNGTLTLTNATPVAKNDAYAATWNSPFTAPGTGVSGNDTDGDGDPLTVALSSGPSHGTLTLDVTGAFTYRPAANFIGTDTFTYRLSDGFANSGVATVTLTVASPCEVPARSRGRGRNSDDDFDANDCARGTPIAKDDRYRTPEGVALAVSRRDVLTNDGPHAETALLVDSAEHGTVTLDADGDFVYIPAPGYYGLDTFSYAAKSRTGVVGPVATVTIVVRRNLAPDADDDVYVTSKNTKLTVNAAKGVLDNDSDPESDPMTVQLASAPSRGTVTLSSNGAFVYTPASGFTGLVTFTYTVRDSFGHTDTGTVRIYVGVGRGNDNGGNKHHDRDDCDHERGRNGHFKGDDCRHDRG